MPYRASRLVLRLLCFVMPLIQLNFSISFQRLIEFTFFLNFSCATCFTSFCSIDFLNCFSSLRVCLLFAEHWAGPAPLTHKEKAKRKAIQFIKLRSRAHSLIQSKKKNFNFSFLFHGSLSHHCFIDFALLVICRNGQQRNKR